MKTIDIKPIKLNPLWGLLILFSLGFPLFFLLVDRPTPPPFFGNAPVLNLTDQNEIQITNASLMGKTTLVNFIFTRCQDVCPALTTKIKHIETQLQSSDDIIILSISVDPEFDTPSVLKEYANRFSIQNPNWHFTTGESQPIRTLMSEFQLAYQILESDAENPNILHSEKIILIDPNQELRGFYSSDQEGIHDLLNAISTL
jgi:cytochrome oxidase Cu insertion factor (SCO1/SenC/PrrC family)